MNKEIARIVVFCLAAATVSLSACTDNAKIKLAISDTCSLDNVVGSTGIPPLFTVRSGSEVVFQGWVADGIGARVPNSVSVEFVNSKNQVQFIDSGELKIKRSDVAAALKSQSVEGAGFAVKSKIQDVVDGEYSILLVGTYDDQKTVCRTNISIIIKD